MVELLNMSKIQTTELKPNQNSRHPLKRGSNKEKAELRAKLMENESIRYYIERRKTKAKKREFTEADERKALNTLLPFFKWVDQSPDELIEQSKENPEFAEKLLVEFFKDLQDPKKWGKDAMEFNNAQQLAMNAQGFFSRNRINLDSGTLPQKIDSKIQTTDAKTRFFEKKKGKWFNNGKLQTFCNALSLDFRTVNIASLSSGGDIEDRLNDKVGLLIDEHGNLTQDDYIFLEGRRHKPPYGKYRTFLGLEATKLYKDVITKRYGATDLLKHKDEYIHLNNRGDRIDLLAVQKANKRAALKIGIKITKNEQHPYRPKRFRRTFKTACGRARIPTACSKTFMGHKKDVHDNYDTMPMEDLLEEYNEVEDLITVYGYDYKVRQQLKEETTENKRQIEELKMENSTQKQAIENLLQLVNDLQESQAKILKEISK